MSLKTGSFLIKYMRTLIVKSPVAQSVEQDPVKIEVSGSSPLGGAISTVFYEFLRILKLV